MTIEFDCDCGMTLRVKNEKAGRTIYCSECDDKLIVPDDSGAQSVEDDEPVPKARKVHKARIADEDDEPPRKRRREEDDDEEEDRPRPRKRKKKRRPAAERVRACRRRPRSPSAA